MSPDQPGILDNAVSAGKRAREVYKYYVPPRIPTNKQPAASIDTMLGAYAQLVSWRLDSRRAMVSLIDRETQYFIAEGTKTLNLEDGSKSDDPADALWAGCVSVEKEGRLCEYTIEALAPPDGSSYPYFEVLDLRQDARFNSLPFVSGPPYFRYYVGSPLRTKNGVNIGSIFALDDKPRSPLSQSHVNFLGTMADNCMSHLESIKEKNDLKRVKIMNMSLAAFVDPDNRVRSKNRRRKARSLATMDLDKASRTSRPSIVNAGVSRSSSSSADDLKRPDDEEDEYIATFRTATSLLRSSLDLSPSSGVVFLDCKSSFSTEEDQSDEEFTQIDPKENRKAGEGLSSPVRPDRGFAKHLEPRNLSEVLASSRELHTTSEGDSPVSVEFNFEPLSQRQLTKMLRKYPRGVLFNLSDDEYNASSSSDEQITPYKIPKKTTVIPTATEISVLRSQFPQARDLIFVPTWNPARSRFAALIAVNCDRYQAFQNSPEFLHCIAFSHCLTTEITRMVTIAADQQKNDFIGSISHELRSPLHGILASCEFLDETNLSTTQKTLVDTADSCARTLLDTINMVLDYSKINAFERNVSKATRNRRHILSTSHLQPALNIYGDVDLSEITESVIEGVATGQAFKDRLGDVDTADVPGQMRHADTKATYAPAGLPEVEIVVDIPPPPREGGWVFLTQPGAFRRVVMNVFGNSLKYTRRGHIRVKLEASLAPKGLDEPEEVHIVTLTISDTGQGISPSYMKTKLFTPFAQESSIAPGTGLGLSLVRSIVRMLHGDIDIKSAVGVGTEVIVKFPMIRSSTTSDRLSESTPSSAGSIERTKDDSLKVVRQKAKGKKAFFFQPNDKSRLMHDTVCDYLVKWYGFDMADSMDAPSLPSIIIVGQPDFMTLVSRKSSLLSSQEGPMILVICTEAATWKTDGLGTTNKNVESISYPFGPYKLARIIRICLDKVDRATVSESTVKSSGAETKETTREDNSAMVHTVDQLKLLPDVKVVQQGPIMANEEFASLMVEALSSATTRSIEQGSEFPFPAPSPGKGSQEDERPRMNKTHSKVVASPTTSLQSVVKQVASPGPSSLSSTQPTQSWSAGRTPRFLLVDDNKVNLRLLQTFMGKRGYKDIHVAEDGAAAVACYEAMVKNAEPHPPDIIFMDISMPVMNGFEATRHIREAESRFRESVPAMERPPSCMIIALTGLASSRDQSEAFTSGFDLYLVKPISFKTVAKLLDGWERNGGASTMGVPHGSVSEDTP